MNLMALKLMAPLTAVAAFGLVACGEASEPAADTTLPPPVSSDAPLDPAATPTPPHPIPSAPPEIPPTLQDPADPTAPPPGAPPPVLPDSPPG